MGLQCTHLHKCFLNHSFSHTVVFQKFMGSTYRCFKETVTLISTKGGGGGGPLPFYLRPADNVTKWDLRHALTPMSSDPHPFCLPAKCLNLKIWRLFKAFLFLSSRFGPRNHCYNGLGGGQVVCNPHNL